MPRSRKSTTILGQPCVHCAQTAQRSTACIITQTDPLAHKPCSLDVRCYGRPVAVLAMEQPKHQGR